MLSLSVAALTSVLVALANPAIAAPIEEHPALLKRATGAHIASSVSPDFCVGVEELKDGAGLFTKNCTTNGASSTPVFYNKWDISPGNNQVVRLSGLPAGSGDFCLDAGDLSGSLRSSKIWTCYPGLPQQQWYYTDDKHIAITGGSGCLETGRYGTPINQCSSNSGSGSQTWNIVEGSGAPPPPPPPANTGKPIKWVQDGRELCLTVGNGYFASGTGLTINSCFDPSSNYYAFQQFLYTPGATKIQVAPNSHTTTNYCVDFGSDRGVNGVGAKIWECYDNLPAQSLWITDDNHIAVVGDNQCMDVRAESGPGQTKPYGSLKDIQSWQCSGGDPYQAFFSR
ncbi:hypothetical protein QFC24_005418 [Naganishia onofrii]|uniref:Uncharacterized protein n=1 Tax=Naganishia onofrii TaxID=1851511 RepID=A0ACC2X7A9_9TREE|nr:hypothetical protein QFC24_005418 [Naganishia onofrii]